MQLYDYFRSSAAYRVRIALNLKGLTYHSLPINFLQGEERSAEYLEVNPQGLIPTLALRDGQYLQQSLAICEYLEEAYPEPALLPAHSSERAQVRAMAHMIACDIHPLNNLRVQNYLIDNLKVSTEQKQTWYEHWIHEGFQALENLLVKHSNGRFCYGDAPGLADICLIPQMYNARRFNCDLSAFPYLRAITEHCEKLEAFMKAHPDNVKPESA